MTTLIRAVTLGRYLEFAASEGLDGLAQVRTAGLPVACLEQPDLFIPQSQLFALLDNSARASGNPFFGLKFGLHQSIDQFGALAYLSRSSNTVKEALENLVRFLYLHVTSSPVTLRVEAGCASFVYQQPDGQQCSVRQGVERAFGLGFRVMQHLCGPGWRAERITVQMSPQEPVDTYLDLLGVMPEFNAAENTIAFAADWLAQPISEADPELRRLMQLHLQSLDHLYDDELPARVGQLIRNFLAQGDACLDVVARQLAMSPRSLQRCLQDEGTSFKELLDDNRRLLAEQYLRESQLQVKQLSDLLGYTQIGSFTRAFSRWFGCSPTKWQQAELPKGRRKSASRRQG